MVWVTHSLPYELPVFSRAQSVVFMVKQVEESISMGNVAGHSVTSTNPKAGSASRVRVNLLSNTMNIIGVCSSYCNMSHLADGLEQDGCLCWKAD